MISNFKFWSPTANRAAVTLAAGLLVAGLLPARPLSADSRPRPASFVERLAGLEAKIARGQRRSRALRAALRDSVVALRQDAAPLDTANRAKRRVKRTVAAQLVAWHAVDRKLRRAQRFLPPGEAADTRVLLDAAKARALKAHTRDIGVLQTIAVDVHRTRSLVVRRADLAVEIAQSEADTDAAEASRKKVVERASKPANHKKVDRELQHADEELQNSLGMLLKNDTKRDFHMLKGTLLPPVTAPVTFGYGPRKQDGSMSYVRHTGLTWKVPTGTPVKCVASGLVVFAGRFEGYGNMVIVDHGQEYHSLYAHLNSLDVEVGQAVKRGGLIGKSGETGSFEGPKLYFELRKDGQPIDPTPWFIQR